MIVVVVALEIVKKRKKLLSETQVKHIFSLVDIRKKYMKRKQLIIELPSQCPRSRNAIIFIGVVYFHVKESDKSSKE